MITIADLDATEKFAEVIGRVALPGDNLVLTGELGPKGSLEVWGSVN